MSDPLGVGNVSTVGWRAQLAVMLAASFAGYWLSALILSARGAPTLFGADTDLYGYLAEGKVVDRIARFHPTTIVLALGWMKILSPLTAWIPAGVLLKGMFAAVGAAGVGGAMSAFAAVLPRHDVLLCTAIYAASLGVWYFSSIDESKIVTASLSAVYIASYLHLRGRWTTGRFLGSTTILLCACLNEIVAGFLILVPLVDTLMRRGWDFRAARWIVLHALAGPVALLVLELVVNGRFVASASDPEGASHFSMLAFYIAKSDHGIQSFLSFLANWLFFNIAAPTPDATLVVGVWPNQGVYFEPSVANYLRSPVRIGLVVLFGVIIIAPWLPRYRMPMPEQLTGIVAGVSAYAVVRAAFFFLFNPFEPLLFSSAVTLAHLLVLLVPFVVSRVPAKRVLLGLFAVSLVIVNGTLITGVSI